MNDWTLPVVCEDGQLRDFANLTADDMDLAQIARALGRIERFGALKREDGWYSVAEHCLRCADVLFFESPVVQLMALTHDAAEWLLGDIKRPIKRHLDERVLAAERRFIEVLWRDKLGITWGPRELALVEEADERMLVTEGARFYGAEGVAAWSPKYAEVEPYCLDKWHFYERGEAAAYWLYRYKFLLRQVTQLGRAANARAVA